MRVKFLIFFLSLMLAFVLPTNGQAPSLKTITLPSPTASSLGKFGESPVSMYTGIPQIGIPLYTIKTRDLELPISLSYHAGGIRVEEVASNVGIGWSLNIGGVITRSIRGLPDIYNSGNTYYPYVTSVAKKYSFNNLGMNQIDAGNVFEEDKGLAMNISSGIEDGEPDKYFYNFGNYSGSFFLAENGQFVTSPKEGIKIEKKNILLYVTQDVAQWILTTPDGVQYVFGVSKDETRSAIEECANGQLRDPITSWYLLDIISPTNDYIKLRYSRINYQYYTRAGETLNQKISTTQSAGALLPVRETKSIYNAMKEPKVDSILFSTGFVVVDQGINRSDLPGAKAINLISVYGLESISRPIKKFQFSYDYSIGGRLTIKNVEEFSGFSKSSGNKYTFTYTTFPNLPIRDVYQNYLNSQDLWGYYNGMSNSSLPPSYSFTINGVTKNFVGADRHADGNMMKAGVLNSITYPTGGKTEFEYEANSVYSNQSFDNIPSVPVPKIVSISYTTNQTITSDFVVANAENGVAKVQFNVHSQTPGCPIQPYSGNSICNNVTVLGVNGTVYGPQFVPEENSFLDLPNGSYRISGQGVVVSGQAVNQYYVKLDWNEYPDLAGFVPANKPIGGLRILRIKNTDGNANIISVKKYLYHRFSDVSKSSGVLVNYPGPVLNYYYYVDYIDSDNPLIPDLYVKDLYAQVKSTPLVPLVATGGGAIGYENVTELLGENGENGKTEFTFTTAKDNRDFFAYYRPYPPPISYEFRRGKLKTETIYKNDLGTFKPIKSTQNFYTAGLNSDKAYGVTVDNQDIIYRLSPKTPYLNYPFYYYIAENELVSEQLFLNQQVIRDYSQTSPNDYLEIINSFEYDVTKGNYQLVKTTAKNSKLETIVTSLKYPQDLTLTGTAETARQLMVTNHIWSPVLQKTVSINSVQNNLINSNYKVFPNGYPLLENIEVKMGSEALEKRIEILKYDGNGNVLQQHKIKDNIQYAIWDYNSTYPIAEIQNASDTNIDSIAYTSFEADGKGNWTFTGVPLPDISSPTGAKCYYLGNSITKSGLNTSLTYVVSYWKKSGTVNVNGTTPTAGRTVRGWTYYEHKVSGPVSGLITVSGTAGIIDELRLYPIGAQMTTYTYKPLVGTTSQCDANNRITYFDYDQFNRLFLVRDQDFNVIKRVGYTYDPQNENNSLVFNEIQSGLYPIQCTSCLLSQSLSYSVPAGAFMGENLTQANQIAQEYLAANGQNYINATGVCTTPVNITLAGSNSQTVSFTVLFTNLNTNCTPLTYNYTVNAGASNVNLGTMKEGNYNVTFSAGTNPSGYTYRVNGLTIHSTGGTIYNVPIRTGTANQVVITP